MRKSYKLSKIINYDDIKNHEKEYLQKVTERNQKLEEETKNRRKVA